MERRSNPTRRVTSILGLLASEAPTALTLSAIAGRLELSLSTCHGILNELRDAGYVERQAESKGYTLGTAVLGLSQAARSSRPALGSARAELRQLSRRFGKVCTIATTVRNQVVVLERIGDAEDIGQLGHAGSRYPFDAPVGLMFVAWDSDDAVDAWLGRAPIELEARRLRRIRAVIEACRQTGYLVERMTEVDVRLHRMLRLVDRQPQAVSEAFATAAAIFGERDYLVQELSPSADCSVSVVCAPSFDLDGRPHLVLSMYVLDEHVAVSEVREIGERLRAACDAVTEVDHGYDPWRGRADRGAGGPLRATGG
jgi:DNA-binding IclR family transcriptional regulator